MDPLLKWPGGKTAELRFLDAVLPTARRIVEPFAGGAALTFRREPEAALLNDAASSLIGLYRSIGEADHDFGATLTEIVEAWPALCEAAGALTPCLVDAPSFDERAAAATILVEPAQSRAA